MSERPNKQATDANAELEREIREGRKFTLEEAIGRLAGPGAMKGESPVARLQQAAFEIEDWLKQHVVDPGGQLQVVMNRHISGSEILLNNFNQPLVVLASYCQRVLNSDYFLKEVVRETDVEWGRVMGERPYFEKEGAPPNPDDPYTIESVRNILTGLLDQLAVDIARS